MSIPKSSDFIAESRDYDTMARIWLEVSLRAHDFIPAEFWRANLEAMRGEYLPSAQNFAYTDPSGEMLGFISLGGGGHIEALFVRSECQGLGIGSRLLEFAQGLYPELTLWVYAQNAPSVEFYLKRGFTARRPRRDRATGCEEILMLRTRQ